MGRKSTCEELEQRIKELEGEIDKRKQAKVTLRDSEARLKALSDASFEAIFFSEKGVCLDQNRTAERMFGYTHTEAVGRSGTDWIIPEDRERVKNNMLSGYEKPYKVTALRKEGTTFSCEIQARMTDCRGRFIRITALRDITERKKAEVTLKLRERIFDSLSNHIFFLDKNYIYRAVNNAYLAAHKKSREEIVGHSIPELMEKKVFDGLIKEKIDRCFAGKLIRHESWFDFPGLGKRFMDVVYHPYSENNGSVSGIIVVSHDITKRKIAEKALAEKTTLLDNILKNAQDIGIVTTDLDFRINYYNPMAEELLGSAEEEVFGKTVQEIHTKEKVDPGRFERAVEIVRRKGKYCYSVTQETEDGPRYLESQVAGIFDPASVMVGFSLFCRDVTKHKQTEELVHASLREKEVLLREIHHRVKNNMQVIVSLLRMHSRRIDDARLVQIFDDCRCRVNAMALIHEALYLSKDLAKIDFEVYLKKLCRNLSQTHGASGKGIKVTIELCNVVLDMDQGIAVGMVISELVSNAFKHAFLPGKGGRISVSLSCLEGKDVELIVKDDGKGLPPEIDILNTRSLGLRLAAAAITRELCGSIKVERNGGTQFIIHFKCKSK